jgi:hypothetical protein
MRIEIERLKNLPDEEPELYIAPPPPAAEPTLQRMTVPDYIEADKIMKAYVAKYPCAVPF